MYGYGYSYPTIPIQKSGAAGTTYLYDTYPFTGGYSVRAINGNNYSGALVRIRRSSDNAEKDFYPDTNGDLSLSSEDGAGTSLTTWISTSDGFIVTWYDQSGSANNITQATAANQPKIVVAGALNTVNGKAAPDFYHDGSNISMLSATITYTQPFTGFGVALADSTTGIIASDATNSGLLRLNAANSLVRFGTNHQSTFTVSAATQFLLYSLANSTASETALNGGTAEVGDASTGGITTLTIGAFKTSAGGGQFDGHIQEIVIYNTDQSSNKSGIESEINTFFSVY